MEQKVKVVNQVATENTLCDIIRIEPGTIEGVNIPAIIALPQNMRNRNQMILVFNNQGSPTTQGQYEKTLSELPSVLAGLNIEHPVIIPILPPMEEFNDRLEKQGIDLLVGESMQFAVECFDKKIPEIFDLYRIDKQVIRLIESVKYDSKLQSQIQMARELSDKLSFDEGLVGFGHSGAGAALLRFSLIAPEMFDKIIIGGNGDIIPTPLGENGKKLPYPFGINGYAELFDRVFSENDYRNISFQYYIGDREDEKEIYDTIRDNNYEDKGTGVKFAPRESAEQYKAIYGRDFFERFKNVLAENERQGLVPALKIYDNDIHGVITREDIQGILSGEKMFTSNASKRIDEMLARRKKKSVQSLGQETLEEQKCIEELDSIENRELSATKNGEKTVEE